MKHNYDFINRSNPETSSGHIRQIEWVFCGRKLARRSYFFVMAVRTSHSVSISITSAYEFWPGKNDELHFYSRNSIINLKNRVSFRTMVFLAVLCKYSFGTGNKQSFVLPHFFLLRTNSLSLLDQRSMDRYQSWWLQSFLDFWNSWVGPGAENDLYYAISSDQDRIVTNHRP